jgi:hypothetical protein
VRVMQGAHAAVKDGTADPAQQRMIAARDAGLAAGGEHGSFRSVVPLLSLFLYACLPSPTQLRLYLVGHTLVLCLEQRPAPTQ